MQKLYQKTRQKQTTNVAM